MSNPITIDNLGTLIINDKNLALQSDLDTIINKFNQFNNLVANDSGDLVAWVKPTNISSITTLSSLPDSFIFIKNKITRQRITFTSTIKLHSNNVSKLISYIQISVSGITYNLDLTTSGIEINPIDKTIDFNYIATSLSQHDIILKLKNLDFYSNTIIDTDYKISVLGTNVYEFPSLDTTVKNSPYDNLAITVGQTLSMTSSFSGSLHNDISANIVISDGTTNPTVSSSISGSNLNYSFTVLNDSDHSATITLTIGTINNTYSWSAAGILTAANDIYTFPNYVTFDGTSNSYDAGKHLRVDRASNLLLTFTGGDQLHSDTYSSQVSSITYKTGSGGSLVTVPESDTTVDSSTGNETILLQNVIATEVDDVYFYVTLKAPDGKVMASPLLTILPSTAVEPPVLLAYQTVAYDTIPEYSSQIGTTLYNELNSLISFSNAVGAVIQTETAGNFMYSYATGGTYHTNNQNFSVDITYAGPWTPVYFGAGSLAGLNNRNIGFIAYSDAFQTPIQTVNATVNAAARTKSSKITIANPVKAQHFRVFIDNAPDHWTYFYLTAQ